MTASPATDDRRSRRPARSRLLFLAIAVAGVALLLAGTTDDGPARCVPPGHDAAAVGALRVAIVEDPGDIDALLELAHRCVEAGQLRAALDHYLSVLAIHPHPEALSHLAHITLVSGDAGTALELVEHSLELAPEEPEARLIHANVLYALGEVDAGARALTALLASDPPPDYRQAATELLRAGRARSAPTTFTHGR